MLINVAGTLLILLVIADVNLLCLASRYRTDPSNVRGVRIGTILWAFREQDYDERGRRLCSWGRRIFFADIFVGTIFVILLKQKHGWFS